jgi:hypothetical protein
MKPISSWVIKVWYEDGTSEEIADMPDDVAQTVDDYIGQ